MWMSPDWYQTHQLCNTSKDFCATLNCYRYGEDDEVQWNQFDFVNNDGEMENFMPNTDFNFGDLMRIILNENWEKSKASNNPASSHSAASNIYVELASKSGPAANLNTAIVAQENVCRKLKADRADKADIYAEVKKLKALKAEFKTVTSVDWNPSMIVWAAAMGQPAIKGSDALKPE